jgi:DnaJ-class molecular chaperone
VTKCKTCEGTGWVDGTPDEPGGLPSPSGRCPDCKDE